MGLQRCLEGMQTGVHRIAVRVPSLPAEEVVLMRMMMMAAGIVGDGLDRHLRPHKLGESEFRTLLILFSSPDGRGHPGELGCFATQTPANMTRIVDNLARRGFVTRTPSDTDRRRIVLQITVAGQRFVRKLLPQLSTRVEGLFAGFSNHQKRQFSTLLRKLLHNIDTMTPPQGSSA